uniref:Transmembrane protein n=1 Tax=Compsopogon caeruleus TaxID=31354 RepID=A0A6T6AZA9_9RHOD|mmetsp:Transcript_1189/g.2478  ORF Transcript_1189/g.2478 Transcript_1189/m.2478 type:complete len:882 (+) Transcript_1189:265-2910(+)|eukprot:CAMPEP_0184681050 /NCGR_PEP_ID=MMETSP0312-20130426/4002_1 /TAXON_ID=31354 /ORGANISM="Compsopogon coeruleus, Strain SAG 36.94" /LENGTH=881 /DNA_ID=CAMNT_0027131629 /DNA_START=199 /DNA_END=2844 /DNA_ORIENTATION=-
MDEMSGTDNVGFYLPSRLTEEDDEDENEGAAGSSGLGSKSVSERILIGLGRGYGTEGGTAGTSGLAFEVHSLLPLGSEEERTWIAGPQLTKSTETNEAMAAALKTATASRAATETIATTWGAVGGLTHREANPWPSTDVTPLTESSVGNGQFKASQTLGGGWSYTSSVFGENNGLDGIWNRDRDYSRELKRADEDDFMMSRQRCVGIKQTAVGSDRHDVCELQGSTPSMFAPMSRSVSSPATQEPPTLPHTSRGKRRVAQDPPGPSHFRHARTTSPHTSRSCHRSPPLESRAVTILRKPSSEVSEWRSEAPPLVKGHQTRMLTTGHSWKSSSADQGVKTQPPDQSIRNGNAEQNHRHKSQRNNPRQHSLGSYQTVPHRAGQPDLSSHSLDAPHKLQPQSPSSHPNQTSPEHSPSLEHHHQPANQNLHNHSATNQQSTSETGTFSEAGTFSGAREIPGLVLEKVSRSTRRKHQTRARKNLGEAGEEPIRTTLGTVHQDLRDVEKDGNDSSEDLVDLSAKRVQDFRENWANALAAVASEADALEGRGHHTVRGRTRATVASQSASDSNPRGASGKHKKARNQAKEEELGGGSRDTESKSGSDSQMGRSLSLFYGPHSYRRTLLEFSHLLSGSSGKTRKLISMVFTSLLGLLFLVVSAIGAIHRHALLCLSMEYQAAFCILFLYCFPLLARLITTVAPPAGVSGLWYGFLIQNFYSQSANSPVPGATSSSALGEPWNSSTSKFSTAVTTMTPALSGNGSSITTAHSAVGLKSTPGFWAMIGRLVIPIIFLLDGIGRCCMVTDLSGSERIVLAYVLNTIRMGAALKPLSWLSFAAQVMVILVLGTTLPAQWFLFLIGCSTLAIDPQAGRTQTTTRISLAGSGHGV